MNDKFKKAQEGFEQSIVENADLLLERTGGYLGGDLVERVETHKTAKNNLGIAITHSKVKIPPAIESEIINDIVVPLEDELNEELDQNANSGDGALAQTHQTDRKCPVYHCLLTADVVEGLLFCHQYDCNYSIESGGEL